MGTKRIGAAILAAWAAFGVASLPARADLVVYTGSDAGAGSGELRPNADAAGNLFSMAAASLGPVTLVTFSGAPDGPFASVHLDQGVTITDPLGLEPNGPVIAAAPLGTPDSLYGYNTTQGGTRFLALRGGDVVFTFDAPIQAFRAYFSGVQFGGETITFSDGTSQVLPIGNPGQSGGITFLGFTDAGKSISSLTVSTQGDIIGVDDIRLVPTAVPEPSALALAAIGSLIVAGARRGRGGQTFSVTSRPSSPAGRTSSTAISSTNASASL